MFLYIDEGIHHVISIRKVGGMWYFISIGEGGRRCHFISICGEGRNVPFYVHWKGRKVPFYFRWKWREEGAILFPFGEEWGRYHFICIVEEGGIYFIFPFLYKGRRCHFIAIVRESSEVSFKEKVRTCSIQTKANIL